MNKPTSLSLSTPIPGCQSGMTMIEILISIVVAAIVAGSIAAQVANTVKYSQLTRQQHQALFLVEEKMEEILHLRDTAGTDGINATTFPDETPIAGEFGEYSRYFTFRDDTTGTCPTGTATDCLEVGVTVKAGGEFMSGTKVVFLKGGPWVAL